MSKPAYENFILKNSISNEPINFGTCIVQTGINHSNHHCYAQLNTVEDSNFDGQTILLTLSPTPQPEMSCFGHSEVCPARESNMQGVVAGTGHLRVGVCVVVVSGDHVLVSRRAAGLRTFPLRWVFPGGHVDKGETLEEAGKLFPCSLFVLMMLLLFSFF
eukprot:TRINITY_DN7363_c1_g1_i5.p1 TRINITY_DN7363_c1_g1~~TRINITY_DN7363_c1_g1_i5.p1  ORF type:complete len:185 (-),score=29.08 TRINITY_DN7363_c1_g1_i5:96-575(-)